MINAKIDDKKCKILLKGIEDKSKDLSVLPRLVKSLYKTYFLNIPYFMRVRKRFDAEKIRKIG